MDSESPVAACIAGQEIDSSGETFFTAFWRLLGWKPATLGTVLDRDADADADASRSRVHRRSATGEAA